MLLLYSFAIRLYYLSLLFASLFNQKAKQWITGRKLQVFIRLNESIWFHFASLGEFEQGRPVLEKCRELYPGIKIVITFFSPSGYEVRKNTPLADAVYYLPLDTAANARAFIDAIKPKMAIFTKYEYWYFFFAEARRRDIPLYIISGIFRPGQVFFKWYGKLHRKMLACVSWFFLQDDNSKRLLQQIGITNVAVSGDTRFDRVWENAAQPRKIPGIAEFTNGHKVFIAGSTWPADEKLVASLIGEHPDWKFIIAPHEVTKENIENLIALLPPGSAIKYSQLTACPNGYGHSPYNANQTLVIDNIGMLSSIYQYGDTAYIGGGFGVGIHNTLEAAAFGLPVVFGPNYTKFIEAHELLALKAGFSINNETELKSITEKLFDEGFFYDLTAKNIKSYVEEKTGATNTIITQIRNSGRE